MSNCKHAPGWLFIEDGWYANEYGVVRREVIRNFKCANSAATASKPIRNGWYATPTGGVRTGPFKTAELAKEHVKEHGVRQCVLPERVKARPMPNLTYDFVGWTKRPCAQS